MGLVRVRGFIPTAERAEKLFWQCEEPKKKNKQKRDPGGESAKRPRNHFSVGLPLRLRAAQGSSVDLQLYYAAQHDSPRQLSGSKVVFQ
jgi:hypothetical protein